MSKAGIQSNRGDDYQTLVAFDWALTVLTDQNFEWIEIDSALYSVDDIVIGKVDGSEILCQCKKNQPKHRAWSIADLADELRKAIASLKDHPESHVHFYSGTPFGVLSALKEDSTVYPDDATYQANIGKVNRATDAQLGKLLLDEGSSLSTYQFLQRTSFETTPSPKRMRTKLRERLCGLVSNSTAAFDALWRRLWELAARQDGEDGIAATRHRLTKADLKALLAETGSMLAPPLDRVAVCAAFKDTSKIGRAWCRDIGNERLFSPAVDALIAAIDAKQRTILLTGLPGSGKTCVMLAVQDRLEERARTRSDFLPLFIQSREFADTATMEARRDLGLSEHWVEYAARMAESAHVVVLIDSLDVLSIAREHSVLTYFLAQIDRLALIPNLTIVTACRDFDCHYDRRIAVRDWEKKIACEPLDWNGQIAPLLVKLGIDMTAIDEVTRQLIGNPRELALFVELAQRGDTVNAVTSQALAQRYLETIVRDDGALGDVGMRAIEDIAAEMLKTRSLAVPRQRFAASQEIRRALLSNRVLHETENGLLTFGHQTLLDVLVISHSIRHAMTLDGFIRTLPPVPFIRPTIRSFVAALATGDRSQYRKQLRTVLTGTHAFHLRRLVAESCAAQVPHDDDWMLIRDLHDRHRDMFQAIYMNANREAWHHFWMRFLVPHLRATRDTDGLLLHVNRISYWKNADPIAVIEFWSEMLAFDGMNKTQIYYSISRKILDIDQEYLSLCVPIVMEFLKLPKQKNTSTGKIIARYIKVGVLDDTVLWEYVAGAVGEEDVLDYDFNGKLYCERHEFGNDDKVFLAERMQQSEVLLDLAIASVERWSEMRRVQSGAVGEISLPGFLDETSYKDTHSKINHRVRGTKRILLDAIEAALLRHAHNNSAWWQGNRRRLCLSMEGALRYFAILACTAAPIPNLDLIGSMLCEMTRLKSHLSYELGTLMQAAFIHLDAAIQDKIQAGILTLWQDAMTNSLSRAWILPARAQLILALPCHLRSPAAQAIINECEQSTWPLVRQPHIGMQGGMVVPPFSFEVFLHSSDDKVQRLLDYFKDQVLEGDPHWHDRRLGGAREVGQQLREAASRAPRRFMRYLSEHGGRIPNRFRDDLMDGVAAYLAMRYGNVRPGQSWSALEEPDAEALVQDILDELERHSDHWQQNRAAARAIEGCAFITVRPSDVARLVSLAAAFSNMPEEATISGPSIDLLTVGINMARGMAAEGLMILANHLTDKNLPWPATLPDALRTYAADDHPAIRAVMLRRLSYFQSRHPDLGWGLFGLAMQKNIPGLWSLAEPCLYYAYYHSFDLVAPWLARLRGEGHGQDLETWGRISALAALSNRLDFASFLTELKALTSIDAWNGAASVWTYRGNIQQHREQCLAGLDAGLNAENAPAIVVAQKLRNIFDDVNPPIVVPIALIQRCLSLLESDANSKHMDIFGFDAWLNAIALYDPAHALEAVEIYVAFTGRTKTYLHTEKKNIGQLLTQLFAQAEEQEESDGGAMLRRVVAMQDALLAFGVSGVDAWLKAAERP